MDPSNTHTQAVLTRCTHTLYSHTVLTWQRHTLLQTHTLYTRTLYTHPPVPQYLFNSSYIKHPAASQLHKLTTPLTPLFLIWIHLQGGWGSWQSKTNKKRPIFIGYAVFSWTFWADISLAKGGQLHPFKNLIKINPKIPLLFLTLTDSQTLQLPSSVIHSIQQENAESPPSQTPMQQTPTDIWMAGSITLFSHVPHTNT